MRTALIFFLLAFPAWAQEKPTIGPAAASCGPINIKFDVTLDKSPHPLAQPEPGKARVYFIQDRGPHSFGIGGSVEAMIGLDGSWVGVNRNNSYFSVSVEPGEHHACAAADTVELAHFNAEAGGVYYFRVRAVGTRYGIYLFLDSVNTDEAKYLIASFPLGVSQPKR